MIPDTTGGNGRLVSKSLEEQVGGSHYKNYAIQPVEYCQKNKLNHCESAIVKYATRHQDKNGREDVLKIIHYAQIILDIEYPEDTYEQQIDQYLEEETEYDLRGANHDNATGGSDDEIPPRSKK